MKKTKVIAIAQKEHTATDKRTGIISLYKPFRFPTGESSILIISNIDNPEWEPSTDIEKVTITFKDYGN